MLTAPPGLSGLAAFAHVLDHRALALATLAAPLAAAHAAFAAGAGTVLAASAPHHRVERATKGLYERVELAMKAL